MTQDVNTITDVVKLHEEKRSVYNEMKKFKDVIQIQKRSLNDTETKEYNDLAGKYQDFDARIEVLNQMEARDKAMAEKIEHNRREDHGKSQEELRAKQYDAYLRTGTMPPRTEQRGQTVSDPIKGGYTVPQTYAKGIITDLEEQNKLLSVCNVMRTSNGNPITLFTGDDENAKSVHVDELNSAGNKDTKFGALTIGAEKFSSKTILVSNDLIADAGFDIVSHIGGQVTNRHNRMLHSLLAVGEVATDKVGGFAEMVHSSNFVSSAEVGKFTSADIINLVSKVDEGYASSPNARLVLSRDSEAKIMLEAIGHDKPGLFTPGFKFGQENKIGVYKYIVNSSISDVAAGNDAVFFGDFNQFRVRIVDRVSLKRIVDKYAEEDAVGFVGFLRWDTAVLQPKAFAKLTIA